MYCWSNRLDFGAIPITHSEDEADKMGPPEENLITEGSFEVKTSDNMDRWQAEMGRVREEKKEDQRRESLRRKEDPGAQKGRKVAKHYVFPMICGSRGSKSRLKRRVQSQLARWEMKNCTPLWREAHFQIKMYKSAFRSCDVEKDRKSARRSRSTFRSQKCKKLTVSEHFWKLRCRKSARRCGAKHISKVKSARKLRGTEHFWTFRCGFVWQSQGDCAPFQKWAKRAGFVAFRKTIGRRGTFGRGSAKIHFPWQAQYKRHVHQRC